MLQQAEATLKVWLIFAFLLEAKKPLMAWLNDLKKMDLIF